MISIKTESALRNNLVRRRYEVTLTDLLGNNHTDVLGMFTHEKSNDGSQVEQEHLLAKKIQEIDKYKEGIRQNINLFRSDSLWNTRTELLLAVLNEALSLPATDPLVYNGLPYLALVSDAELMAIYQQDQAWVDAARLKAANLLTAKTSLDDYEAVL